MLPTEIPASSGPAAQRAWWCRTQAVSATSVAVSATFTSAAMMNSLRSAPDRSGPGPERPAGRSTGPDGRRAGPATVITAIPVSASRTATAAAGATPVARALASTGPVM